MKIIKESKKKLKTYIVEYWFQSFLGDDDMGYDFDQVKVEAISPTSAIKKAKVTSEPAIGVKQESDDVIMDDPPEY